jgi:phosphoesterase RecJ-like protein
MIDFSQAISAIQQSNNILILPSIPADGDSISSALALYITLKAQGKTPTVLLTKDVPEVFKFLPEAGAITREADIDPNFVMSVDLQGINVKDVSYELVEGKVNIVISPENGRIAKEQVSFPEAANKYDLLMTVDCADLTQLGDFYTSNGNIFGQIPSVNIDHHESNGNYASVNLVDISASSTTQILVAMFKQMNIQMTPDLATLLLAGIITDTGSFQNPNTTPECFDIAADLIDKGARQQEIIKHVYKTKQLETLKLWGRILSNINIEPESKLVWVAVTRAMFSETGTREHEVGDIIDELLGNAEEAEVVMMLIEKADGSLHGSIRTTTEQRDATKIAGLYGGGGHTRAAGFTIMNTTVAERGQEIINAVKGLSGQVPAAVQEPVQAPAEPVIQPSPEPVQPAEPVVETVPAQEQANPVVETPASQDPSIVPDFLTATPEPVFEQSAPVEAPTQVAPAEPVVEPAPQPSQDQENPEKRIEELTRNFVAPTPTEQPVKPVVEEKQPPSGPPAPLI